MATCTECGGAGTLPSGRYESCYRCGGSGHGGSTDTPCMACSGSGRSGTEVRDSCWGCNGGGIQADPASGATRAGAGGAAQTAGAGSGTGPAAGSESGETNPASGPIAGIAAVAAVVYGGYERFFCEAGWGGAAIAAGIVFVLCLIGLHLLYGLLRFLLDLAKVAVPIAMVIAVGYWFEWELAQDAVAVLSEAWDGTVSFVKGLWEKIR